MPHSHHGHKEGGNRISDSRLFITMVMNLVITVAEIVGGVLSGSLSLISDALHNFSDAVAIIISYAAIKLGERPKNLRYTFGYKRAQIFAALLNSSVLILISLYLLVEAYKRFVNPEHVEGGIMLAVASVGLAANIAGTLLLRRGAEGDMNIRSSYLHLLSDALSSMGVILGGIFIYFFSAFWIDPLLTVLISLYILKESYTIVKEASKIGLMASPPNISLDTIKNRLEEIDEIINVHHGHLWQLDEKEVHFEAHVEVPNITVSRTNEILKKIEKILREEFGITHVTVQFEHNICEEKEIV